MNNTISIAEYKALTSKGGGKKGHPEHDEQVKVFEWASVMSSKMPELKLLFAIPNGAFYGGHWSVANRMKAEGVKSGVPDIFLPVKKIDVGLEVVVNDELSEQFGKVWCGLWIEMKAGKNKVSPEQEWWLEQLTKQGYLTRVCYSAEEAISEIEEYLIADDK